MGSRGPVAKRARAARTAEGKRLRQLPDDADAIFRRLARDIAGLEPGDRVVVEGSQRVRPGATVTVATASKEPATGAQTAPQAK